MGRKDWLAIGLTVVASFIVGRTTAGLPVNDCVVTSGELPLLRARSAGCAVAVDGKLLVVRKVDITGRRHGGVGPPGGGVERGEIAQCAAARETLEETGVAVTVGQRLYTFKTGFVLYRCTPASARDRDVAKTPKTPANMLHEVSEKLLLEPGTMRNGSGKAESWAYPSNALLEIHWDRWRR